MTLRLYDTKRREVRPLQPIIDNHVRMYVCGVTTYDYCHIGHARVAVVFDVLVRYLRQHGVKVTYVRNITDIDDKIIARAAENGVTPAALAAKYIQAMHEDYAALHILPPTQEPCATKTIDSMLKLIATLIDKGFAYVSTNGDVYYRTRRFTQYGALSGKQLDELIAGSRVAIEQGKEDPLDFVLWKRGKNDEPSWPSPWGNGRPGWHIECSAMAETTLGTPFDIHGGGMDLIFPHHENEIAQSEAATDTSFANTWMHVGFVRVDNEKMSKSLGNFFTIRDVLKRYHPETIRLFLLSSHYRSPLQYSDAQLDLAHSGLMRLYRALDGIDTHDDITDDKVQVNDFSTAMNNDLNTPQALACLYTCARALNTAKEEGNMVQAEVLARTLRQLGKTIGIFHDRIEIIRQQTTNESSYINALFAERESARKSRNFIRADAIRDELRELGILVEDQRL